MRCFAVVLSAELNDFYRHKSLYQICFVYTSDGG